MRYLFMLCLVLPVAGFAADLPAPSAAPSSATVQASGVPSAAAVNKTMDAVNDALAATAGTAVAAPPPATRQSLFFTPNQIASIMRAYQGFLPPGSAYDEHNQSAKPSDPIRVISLSGILFHAPGDWTIWLNGERVTPKNKPDHVMGLVVTKDRVFLRWMDIGNQRIVNLTLRAHEAYNLDTDTITSGS